MKLHRADPLRLARQQPRADLAGYRQFLHGAGQRLHLADGDFVEPLQPVTLGQLHGDELGVEVFQVGEDEELLDRGVVAQVRARLTRTDFAGRPKYGRFPRVGLFR